MHELEQVFRNVIAKGLNRESVKKASDWALRYRVMKDGLWRFDKRPWLREMHDSTADRNVGMKSAQVGYTEAVLNITFFSIDVLSQTCLYVFPTMQPDASRFSSSRFDVALSLSDHLNELFSDVKNIGVKRAGAATLYIGGARSRNTLKSIDPDLIILDELDEMPDEGIQLALRRSDDKEVEKVWMISTPTVPEVGIHGQFLQTTQEFWTFKCPKCGRRTRLIYPECLVVTSDDPWDDRIKDSHVKCLDCKQSLSHEEKCQAQLDTGKWVAESPGGSARGFHVNQLYSFNKPVYRIARDHIHAQFSQAAEQELWNSTLGLPHVIAGGKLTDEEINSCLYNRDNEHPKRPKYRFVTMGIDVGKFHHYTISGWKFSRFGNDLNVSAQRDVLRVGKVKHFYELKQLMKQYQIHMAVIDWQPEETYVYEFAMENYGHVKRCQFARGTAVSKLSVKPPETEQFVQGHRTFWIDMALQRFRTKRIRVPKNIPDEFRKHLKAQVKYYKEAEDGRDISEFRKTGPDHYSLALTYDEMALPLMASAATDQPIRSFL